MVGGEDIQGGGEDIQGVKLDCHTANTNSVVCCFQICYIALLVFINTIMKMINKF